MKRVQVHESSSIGALFRERARIDRTAVALIEGERRVSYGELNDRVNRLVHVLVTRGVRPGDRVAILARNCAAYVAAAGPGSGRPGGGGKTRCVGGSAELASVGK